MPPHFNNTPPPTALPSFFTPFTPAFILDVDYIKKIGATEKNIQ